VLFQLLPHHRVVAVAGGHALGLVGHLRQRQVDLLDRDRPVALDAEPLQALDDLVGRLPGHVTGDQVALRRPRRAGEHDHVRRPGTAVQRGVHRLGTVLRHDRSEVKHALIVPYAPRRRSTRP
jgi:hypothetical protein